MSEYQSTTPEGEAMQQSYKALVDSIRRNMDPTSNTVLVVEHDEETIIITLSNPTNASLGADKAITLTVNDNDAEAQIKFQVDSQSVTEATVDIKVTAVLEGETSFDLSVPFSLGGTAGPSDFATIGDFRFDFPEGTTQRSYTISVIDDTL